MPNGALKKILYVEDDTDLWTIAQISLVDLGGFEVKFCLTGQEALRVALEFRPDLILLDYMMPGMNGSDTLKELRKIPALAQTPVVFLTAKIQPDEVAQYRAEGAAEVIPKPFDPMRLADTVRSIWNAT
jgi:CheY-like chemotaxis protein